MVLLLVAFLFLEVVPNWRMAAWVAGFSLAGITGCVLYLLGGRKWVNHFTFPVLFFLVAIPWPTRLEAPLIEVMAMANAVISTFVSNVMGMPAIRQGIVIQTGAGTVGVEDACSGIRSLQASITIALFLGELFRYGFFRRIFFLIAGAFVAFVCNVVRTTYLVRLCDASGSSAVTAGHDSAGFVIMGITFAGLLVLAWLLRGKGRSYHSESDGVTLERGGEDLETEGVDNAQVEPSLSRSTALLGVCGIMITGIIGFELGCQAWFGSTERLGQQAQAWAPVFPTNQSGFREIKIAKSTAEMLKYDEGRQLAWSDSSGRTWRMFYLRWLPARSLYRSAEIAVQARSHAPVVCLTSIGMVRESGGEPKVVDYNGLKLLSTFERYSDKGTGVYVMALYWEPASQSVLLGLRSGKRARSPIRQAVEALKRHDRGQGEKRVIKIASWGMASDHEAEIELEKVVRSLVRGEAQDTQPSTLGR
jgi:exosortase